MSTPRIATRRSLLGILLAWIASLFVSRKATARPATTTVPLKTPPTLSTTLPAGTVTINTYDRDGTLVHTEEHQETPSVPAIVYDTQKRIISVHYGK